MRHVALSSAFALLISALPADATVYEWRTDGGVIYLCNDIDNVPPPEREAAIRYTSTLAGSPHKVETTNPAPPVSGANELELYQRGLERGLETAAQQVALAGELARTILAAVPRQAAPRIIVKQVAPIVRYVTPEYGGWRYGGLGWRGAFSGFIGPYAPYYGYGGYGYGFGSGRFIRHSRFYPGRFGPNRGIFFPRGTSSRNGYLFGHGLVVR